MYKMILLGKSGAGKTTLIQALKSDKINYRKTQTVEYYSNFIDTPGEFVQNRIRYNALISLSYDASIVALVQDSTDPDCFFTTGFGNMFNKRVIGIVTKCNARDADVAHSVEHLLDVGAKEIFVCDSVDGDGIEGILNSIRV